MTVSYPSSFHLYAYLPFVELAHESMIQLGPVIFWPASKSEEFLSKESRLAFRDYMQAVGQIKARCVDTHEIFINTAILELKGTTCVSISHTVPPEFKESILVDSLYLLYFACTFRSLYYGQEVPSFNAFRKMIPASIDFINTRQDWEHLYIDETDREETVCLHLIDPEICLGLGKALGEIYHSSPLHSKEVVQNYKSLVRSIRYLVDRFFQRFVNLFDKGLHFSKDLFDPEDVIFLASSFEALLDLNDKQPAADFKHKLRPLLHLKYSKPVEMFWKWVDDFYEAKRRITHGDIFLDPLFHLNPNFEISHIFLGIKLFVYTVYYKLFKYQLLHSIHADAYTPPDFRWIHPEEVLLFFWTEMDLLRKLNLFIKRLQQKEVPEEIYADIHLLTHLCVSLYDRYYFDQQLYGQGIVHFIPTAIDELKNYGESILHYLKQELISSKIPLMTIVHPRFIEILERRLQEPETVK